MTSRSAATHAALAADVLTALTAAGTIQAALQGCAEALVTRVGAAFARIWTLNEFDRVLEPGDKIVFHTDGLLEAPGPGGEFGAGRLQTLLATCGGLDVGASAARLEEVILAHQGGVSRDDMAILVLGA